MTATSHQHLPTGDALYRTLVAGLPGVAVFLLGRDLRVLLADGEALGNLSFSGETTFEGRLLSELREVPQALRERAGEHYEAVVAGEHRQFTFTDAGSTFQVNATPLAGAGEARVLVVARDITQAVEAQTDLLRAHVRYRNLLDNVPDTSIGIIDEDLRWIVLEGDAVLSRLGVLREELLGRVVGSVDAPLAEATLPHVQRALKGRSGRLEWRSPDERTYVIDLSPIRGVTGCPNALVAVTDVTDRRAETVQIRQLEERFEQAFQFAPIGMALVTLDDDYQGKIVRANQALCDLLGYTRAELERMTLLDVAHPDEHSSILARGRMLAAAPASTVSAERRYVTSSGQALTVSLTAAVLEDAGTRLALVHVQDLTARLRAEQEQIRDSAALLQFQKLEMVGQLAGGVAHDFNNLLSVILHSADFALEGLDGHPAAEELQQIRSAARRAAELTKQLLALSRQEVTQPEAMDLNTIVSGVTGLLRRTIGEHIALEFDLTPEPVVVHADPNQIEQIVLNLALNARDAMPQGGRLRLETRLVALGPREDIGLEAGDYAAVAVSDTGSGMTEAVLARSLEPFFTTKAKGTGTGLGLATAYGNIKQNGGHLEIESQAGSGTTVRFHLPILAAQYTEASPEQPSNLPTGHGERVLVVEDQADLGRVIVRILTAGGYVVECVNSAAEGLAAAAHADLVVTDVVMPGLSGTGMVERLRADRPGLAAIFMSGYTNRPDILPAGDVFLSKPFSRRDLLESVARALDSASPSRPVP